MWPEPHFGIVNVLMQMLALSKAMHSSGKAISMHWYGHVFRSNDGHVLGMVLDLRMKGHKGNVRFSKTWKSYVEEECLGFI